MDVRSLIIRKVEKRGWVKASEIVELTGFSRAYINRFFQALRNEGVVVLLGRANKARYVLATEEVSSRAKKGITSIRRILRNEDLSEDAVLDSLKRESGIFIGLAENVSRILDYAFTEMLNNAIEHSRSKKIVVTMNKQKNNVRFDVVDKGVGIFNNIMQKKRLDNEEAAIQDLLKGKLSTAPNTHSGEGIFFTSKMADLLIIKSSEKQINFDNVVHDVFVKSGRNTVGTKVAFFINLDSKKNLRHIFGQYADDSFEFSKTCVAVKLYKVGSSYISRSQARRVLSGLDKFKEIVLDFEGVETVGQGFADEVFCVWKSRYPEFNIIAKNANKNVQFMIKRACARREEGLL